GTEEGEIGYNLSMDVTLDNLSDETGRFQSQSTERLFLDFERVLSMPSSCSDNSEDFSNESPFSDLSQAFLLAFYLGEPDSEFQSERYDASVSSMGPRDHEQASILSDHGGESRLQLVQLFLDDVESFFELESCGSVFNVHACKAIVHVLLPLSLAGFCKCHDH